MGANASPECVVPQDVPDSTATPVANTKHFPPMRKLEKETNTPRIRQQERNE